MSALAKTSESTRREAARITTHSVLPHEVPSFKKATQTHHDCPSYDNVRNASLALNPGRKNLLAKNDSLFYCACKRAFDIAFSACVLAVAAIPGAITACAICAESPGGALFRQSRIGKNGKIIRIWKLRSMYSDANEHPERYFDAAQMAQWKREQKADNDPRVTRIGKFIRKTSLDEIPQFLNVLTGDMSVIGPRPVTLSETYEFGADRDEALSVRPGITGWWQVSARNEATWADGTRQALELEYIRNRGFAMDVKCFLGTFEAMFGKNKSGR